MSTTDFTIRETWLYHLNVNKGLSKHSIRAYKVDSQGYIEYLHENGQSLQTSQKNDVRGWFRSLLALLKGANLFQHLLSTENGPPFAIYISG